MSFPFAGMMFGPESGRNAFLCHVTASGQPESVLSIASPDLNMVRSVAVRAPGFVALGGEMSGSLTLAGTSLQGGSSDDPIGFAAVIGP